MSRDVKLLIKKRYITTIIIVTFFNIFYAVTAFGESNEEIELNYTINIESTDSEKLVLELINNKRKENGMSELKFDSRLMKLAKLKANDMIEENYISHNSDKYGNIFNMLKVNSIEYKLAGENIARNANETRAVEAWMNSTTHKENILEQRYEYTGISVVKDKEYGYIFVQIFMEI